MLDESRLHFHCSDPMAGDVEHIIDATENPEIAIAVALRSISREVQVRPVRPLREIGLNVSLVVAPDSAQHRRPRLREREKSAADIDAFASGVEKLRAEAGKGLRRASWFRRCDSRQWRDHDRSSLRLPPRVNDRTAIAPDVLAVPHPA